MRLKRIKVFGFKSFVDPTTVVIKGKLAGVVGPNGCGKSNVIDAVRWVMGESSAKMLRGDSMEDVIFNGSRDRKPVGKASVELLFDNKLGRIKSHYKDFSEIAVRRTLTRDGKSDYLINDKKVRRKDVLDLFRGTGLGPRSYSIIEQGMVSRIVEAKPEDLRAFVEEAAGISKYKDRRRETENRIRNTRENLERVEDIRGELTTQLARLKRQANAAERYKLLQGERHTLRGQHYWLRVQALDALKESDKARAADAEVALEKALAVQREEETGVETLRAELGVRQENLNQAQADYYEAGAKVSKIEQQIVNQQQLNQQRQQNLDELAQALANTKASLEADEEHQSLLDEGIAALSPQMAEAEKSVASAQQVYEDKNADRNARQEEWNAFNQSMQKPAHQKQVLESTINHLTQQQTRTAARFAQLENTRNAINLSEIESQLSQATIAFAEREQDAKGYEEKLLALEEGLVARRQALKSDEDTAASLRAELGALESRLLSLQEIQQHTLDTDDLIYQQWLQQSKLDALPLLAQRLRVTPGWERAADRALGAFLQARVDEKGQHNLWQSEAQQGVTLVNAESGESAANPTIALPLLSTLVTAANISLDALMGNCYGAESLSVALAVRAQLLPGEYIVTRDGVMLGRNWLSHASDDRLNTGYLVREEEIQRLEGQVGDLREQLAPLATKIDGHRTTIEQDERTLAEVRQQFRNTSPQINRLSNDVSRLTANFAQQQERLASLGSEIDEVARQQQEEITRIAEAKASLQQATQDVALVEADREKLAQAVEAARTAYETAATDLKTAQQAQHSLTIEQTRLDAEKRSLTDSITRWQQQLQNTETQQLALSQQMSAEQSPVSGLQTELEAGLAVREQAQEKLTQLRDALAAQDERLRHKQLLVSQKAQQVATAREQLERENMGLQAVTTRREALMEELVRDGYSLDDIRPQDDEEITGDVDSVAADIQKLDDKISRIGAVNLVAIEEFETQSERAEYLQKQYDDLTEALATLEAVIHKIDKETKTRFSSTFHQLQKGFSSFFPKLFGGGRAALSLTSDDLLTTGIAVTAQPPGKRNSTIHLLSGGEKALTAVALLFALFELNPAPFCMMDEVDAPLDDANVARFCETIQSLADHSQIVVITHNKITMEAVETLIGVTQTEAGVSRVVSVNLDDALQMVDEAA